LQMLWLSSRISGTKGKSKGNGTQGKSGLRLTPTEVSFSDPDFSLEALTELNESLRFEN
jgi:hypothetical protein